MPSPKIWGKRRPSSASFFSRRDPHHAAGLLGTRLGTVSIPRCSRMRGVALITSQRKEQKSKICRHLGQALRSTCCEHVTLTFFQFVQVRHWNLSEITTQSNKKYESGDSLMKSILLMFAWKKSMRKQGLSYVLLSSCIHKVLV